jgi:hypothetical protein
LALLTLSDLLVGASPFNPLPALKRQDGFIQRRARAKGTGAGTNTKSTLAAGTGAGKATSTATAAATKATTALNATVLNCQIQVSFHRFLLFQQGTPREPVEHTKLGYSRCH